MEKRVENIKGLSLLFFVTLCALLMFAAIFIAVKESRASLRDQTLTGQSTPQPTLVYTPVPTHRHQTDQYLDEN